MGRKITSVDTVKEILLRFILVAEAGRPFRNAASSCPGMMECPWVSIKIADPATGLPIRD